MKVNANILLILAMLSATPAKAAKLTKVAEITPGQIGEFVTVSGEVAEYFAPREADIPYAFGMEDSEGSYVRIVAWPDIYERVKDRQLLQTSGTAVTVTGVVANYRGKLELHLQDWEEIKITANTGESTTATAVIDLRKPAPAAQPDERETTGTVTPVRSNHPVGFKATTISNLLQESSE